MQSTELAFHVFCWLPILVLIRKEGGCLPPQWWLETWGWLYPMNLASGWSIHVHCLDPDYCPFGCPTYINRVEKVSFLVEMSFFSSFSRAGAHNDAISEQWWLHTITKPTGFWQISQFRDKGINGFILCLVTRVKDVSFVCLIKFSDYDLLQFLQDEADWFCPRAVVLQGIVDFNGCCS